MTHRGRVRRSTQLAVALALVMGSAMIGVGGRPAGPAAAQSAAFDSRYSVNAAGDIAIFGNTVLTCRATEPGCLEAQTDPEERAHNGEFGMEFVDVDGDPATINSSSNPVTVPAGSDVLFAALYWGAQSSATTRGTVLLDGPGPGGYETVVAADEDLYELGANYQGVADITDLVVGEGNGDYTVADVSATQGATNRYGGWAIVVVYENESEPFRNLTVFDGFDTVTQGNQITAVISGFLTPLSGEVSATVGVVAYEGDNGLVGDGLLLNDVELGGDDRPTGNFFNSHRTRDGVTVSEGNPDYVDQLGFDVGLVDATGVLANGEDSAEFTFTTTSEEYFPGVLTSAIELFVPDLETELAKTVTDDDGGVVEVGDVLTYRIASTNAGFDTAVGSAVVDVLPTGVTYVPGSIDYVAGSAALGPKSDAAGDDEAELDPDGRRLAARVGAGAGPATGGAVAPGEAFELTLKVTVDPGTEGQSLANTVLLAYSGDRSGIAFEAELTPPEGTATVVGSSDLSVSVAGPAAPVLVGAAVAYAVTVRNAGPSPSPPSTVRVELPAGLVFQSAASDPTCVPDPVDDAVVVCTVPALAVDGEAGVTLGALVDAAALPGAVAVSATVQPAPGRHDADPTNDTASATTTIVRPVELRVTKTADVEPVEAGGPVVYTVTVTNAGPADTDGVVLDDVLPDGLVLVSAEATGLPDACAGSGAAVRCELGPLAVGGTRSVDVAAIVGTDVAPGTVLAQTAAVTSVDVTVPVTATAATTVVGPGGVLSDLSITKRLLSDLLEPGQQVGYEIVVANAGPSPAASVVVLDPIAEGLRDQTWTCAGDGCGAAGGAGDLEVTVDVPAGGAVVLTVKAEVTESVRSAVVNIARLRLPATVVDPRPGDNAAAVLASAVPNSPPAALGAASPITIAPGGTVTIDPFDYVSDDDGSLDPSTVCVLGVRPASSPQDTAGGTCGAVPAVGTVSVDAASGAITYTAPADLAEPLVLSFEICDQRGGCVTVEVELRLAGSGLAETGSDLDVLAVTGLLAMAVGVALIGWTDRRRLRLP